MPWRNPATGLFEQGNGPVDRRAPSSTGGSLPSDVSDRAWANIAPGTLCTEILGVQHMRLKNQHTQDDQPIGPEPQSENDEHEFTGRDAPKAPGR